MTGNDARALDAVARVRRVRERDSLHGLKQADGERDAAARRLTGVEERVTANADKAVSTGSELVQLRQGLLALGEIAKQARDDVESARTVAMSAQAHWQQDRMRLRTIEMLQERRAERARQERLRAEARVQDEVATQVWLRGRQAVTVS